MNRGELLVTAVIATVAALGVGLVWQPWAAGVPDGAALVVGKDVVTEDELDERNESLRALYGIQAPSDEGELAEFRKHAAKSMAISIVLDRAVEEHGVEVPDAEVDRALQDFVGASFSGDREAFVAALANVGTSEEMVLGEIRRQLELRALLEEVVVGVEVTDDELKAAFDDRRAELATPERRAVSNIVVGSRAEAAQVRDRLEAGADIAVLARRYSIDASTRDSGGALGKVSRKEMLPAVGKAVFAVPPGGVYGPVEGSQGWNVGQVTRVLDAKPARLPVVADRLREALRTEETYEEWSAWLEEELRDADIEYAASYRPSEPYEITSWADVSPTGLDGPALR